MDEVKLRRYRNLLTISGTGVIAFGVWSVIKTILFMTLTPDYLRLNDIGDIGDIGEAGMTVVKIFAFTVLGVIMAIELLLRLYIGLSARAEGNGKKKRIVYVVVAASLLLLSLWSIITSLHVSEYGSLLDMAVSLLLELTSAAAFFETIYASCMVRRLQKKAKEG
ncbi:MAG: hypothetical protein IJV48_00220 [Ruminococcus sp.]|nr:hypothetical protein [Ruminococcus sp.]